MGTGFPKRTCATQENPERGPIHALDCRLLRECAGNSTCSRECLADKIVGTMRTQQKRMAPILGPFSFRMMQDLSPNARLDRNGARYGSPSCHQAAVSGR